MSKTALNTHRRAMRPVTPAVRAGRVAAGATVAAFMACGGAAAATAETAPEASGPVANSTDGAVAPAKIETLALPEDGDETQSATVPSAAGALSVALPEPEPEPEPEVTEEPEPEATEETESTEPEDDESSSDESSESQEQEADPSESSEESAPAPSASGSAILDRARSAIGTPYVLGGNSPGSGLDCSGLVNHAYQGSGISLGRTASQISGGGRTISQSEAQPGDIVSWPGHVGIYAGNGMVVDAGSSKGSVSERSIWGSPSFITYR